MICMHALHSLICTLSYFHEDASQLAQHILFKTCASSIHYRPNIVNSNKPLNTCNSVPEKLFCAEILNNGMLGDDGSILSKGYTVVPLCVATKVHCQRLPLL